MAKSDKKLYTRLKLEHYKKLVYVQKRGYLTSIPQIIVKLIEDVYTMVKLQEQEDQNGGIQR